MSAPDVEHLRHLAPTYPEVGATQGDLPPGYRTLRVVRVLGTGPQAFQRAADQLLGWQLHRRAGVRVRATDEPAVLGTVCQLGVGLGGLRLWAPCRVVLVVDEPHRRGFAYGTLPGHPVSGEELFTVELDDRDRVVLRIVTFSRPGTRWSAFALPLTEQVQEILTARYLHALVDG